MKYDVFISYSSKNSTAAIAICHLLEDSGVRCWMAPRDIPLGEKYATVITKAIKGCKAVVLVFSEQSAISPWVESEINIAFSQHKPIFPYKIDSVKLEKHDAFYLMLNSRHWIDSYPDYRTRFHELVDAVCRAIGKPTPVKESAPAVKMSQRVIKIAISLIVVVLGIIYLASLFADDEKCPANEIWYTSIDNQPLSLKDDEFDVKIYSNAYIDGKGIITFDGELTTIGNRAFAFCESLTSVTIPDSVTTIGERAFYECESLTSVTIPDSVTTIGDSAFCNCYSLTSVTIGDSVTTIEEAAFNNCSSLTSVTISDSVTTIGASAFFSCDSLTSVTIPDSVTTIGSAAFSGCDSLAEFNGKFAADGGRCLIKDNTIIAYAEASGTTYTIPDSVTTIGDSAFCNCCSLTSVTIPDSVTTIGDYAFRGCSSLTSVTIPDSITTIGHVAFYLCTSLTSVDCEATTPPTLGGSYVFDDNASGRKIYVPVESVEAYKAATNWSEYAADIVGYNFETGEEVAISNKLFYTATAKVEPYKSSAFNVAITSNEWDEATGEYVITFDGKLTSIGDEAFRSCSNLTSVTIPDSVTRIGNSAFYWCKSLTSVTIPDSVTTIGDVAFASCKSLTSVTIPDSVTTIGDVAFASCNSLTSVTIPDSVTTIEYMAFYGCSSLTSVTIGDSVTTIGDEAFYMCYSLTSVYCEATTPPTLGGSYVFDYNKSGRKIYVPVASVEAYKSATNWSEYAENIVGYDF